MGSPENIGSNRLSSDRNSTESSTHGCGGVPQKDIWKNVESAPDPTPNNPSVKTITSEASENPNICDAIAIDIGTAKCNIAICKDKHIQIVEHESTRSVPSYVALSEQNEWLVGKMAENYAVCLQNVIYDIRWLLGKSHEYIKGVHNQKKYFFKRTNEEKVIPTFDIIDQGKENVEFVNVEQIFAKLLEPLFATAYKNLQLQRPKTIAITVPIKSAKVYKDVVKHYAENAVERIVDAMSSSTTNNKQDQPEVITVKLIDEPIAVAAAYAPRLNLHPKGDVALVFCMGAGYLQVAAYFIQEKTHQEKANWTDLTIAQISGVEPIVVEDFAGNDIDRLVFDNMMDKVTQQNGGSRPKISTRAERRLKIACEKVKCALSFAPHTRIDVDSLYRNGDKDCDLVEVIQKDEIVEYYREKVCENIEKARGVCKEIKPKFVLLAGGSTRIPLVAKHLESVFNGSTICNFLNVDEVAAIGAAAIVSKTVTVATESIDYKEVTGIIQEQEKGGKKPPMPAPDAKPTPADNTPILNKRDDRGNQLPKSGQPQPVSPIGSCSPDFRDKSDRSERSNPDAVDGVRNKEAEESRDIRRNNSSGRSHENDSTSDQIERQSQSLKNNSYDRPQSPTNCLSLNSSKIGPNSRDKKSMLPASTVESKELSREYASSTSPNPMNTGNQYQPNQYNSAISTFSNSKSNSFGNADQRIHDDQSVKYHEWKQGDRGTHFIHLNLNELKYGLNSYLIDPIELRGISVLILIVPSTQNSPYRMASAEFRAAREVQVHLDLKTNGTYACRIALIGVDIHNCEIIRHLYLPFDGPLDFWRQLSICLELI